MDGPSTRFFLPFNLLTALFAAFAASIFLHFAQAEGPPSLVIAAIRHLTIPTLILAPLPAFLTGGR